MVIVVDVCVSGPPIHLLIVSHWYEKIIFEQTHFPFSSICGFLAQKTALYCFVLFPEKTPHWASCIFSWSPWFFCSHITWEISLGLVISRTPETLLPPFQSYQLKAVCLLPLPGLESHRLWLPCEPQVSPPQDLRISSRFSSLKHFTFSPGLAFFFFNRLFCANDKAAWKKLCSCWGQWAKQHAEMCCFQLPRVPSLASQDPLCFSENTQWALGSI